MRISVIIPCYNVEDRVKDCLDSVLNQSFGLDNIELIIVDDASTDNTVTILKEYEQNYPENIALILCEENGRQGKARNIGLNYATGDWICFVDADDQIHRQMFEVLSAFIDATKADIVSFSYEKSDFFLKENISVGEIDCRLYDLSDKETRRDIILRNDVVNNSCWQKIYSMDLIRKSEVRFAEGVSYEEPLFTYPARYLANRIVVLDIPLYYYHLNPNGTINMTLSDPSTILDHISVQLQLLEYMRKQDYYLDYKNEIELNFLHSFVYEPYIFLKNRGFEMPDSLYERIRDLKNRMVPDWKENPYLKQIPKEEREYIEK